MIALERIPAELTENEVSIEIESGTEGPLSVVGKAPVLAAGRVRVRLAPESGAARVVAEIETASLRVIRPELSSGDREKILRSVRDKLLKAEQIRFEGRVEPGASPAVRGQLFLGGAIRELAIPFREAGAGVYEAELALKQSEYGIAPLTAFFGALRAADEVRIRLKILLPA